MAIEGHCLCGAITYVCDADPILTGVCHCRDCQRQTGTAASVVVAVPTGSLQITGDTLASFTTVGEEHGTGTNRHFCGTCGSPIVSRVDAMPDIEFIKAGTLDDASWVEPTIEFFTRSAHPWETAVPGAQRMERASA